MVPVSSPLHDPSEHTTEKKQMFTDFCVYGYIVVHVFIFPAITLDFLILTFMKMFYTPGKLGAPYQEDLLFCSTLLMGVVLFVSSTWVQLMDNHGMILGAMLYLYLSREIYSLYGIFDFVEDDSEPTPREQLLRLAESIDSVNAAKVQADRKASTKGAAKDVRANKVKVEKAAMEAAAIVDAELAKKAKSSGSSNRKTLHKCGGCNVEKKLRMCEGCYREKYCGSVCQKACWHVHKDDCKIWRKESLDDNEKK